jgi:integrase
MARSIRASNLETRTARLKLPISTKPTFVRIGPGLGLGYRRNTTAGTWVARIADGRGGYATKAIGTADDFADADDAEILGYWEAQRRARQLASGKPAEAPIMTLADALDAYQADLKTRGRQALNVTRVRKHLTSAMLKKPIALLTVDDFRKWRDGLVKSMTAASANRTCRGLKAALNRASDHDDSLSRRAWTVGLALIPNAEQSRNVILAEDAVRRIIATARDIGPEFGLLVECAAVTGARTSQLARIEVQDLTSAKLSIPVSRKGRGVKTIPSHLAPLPAGLAARLRQAAAGRPATSPLLLKPSGAPWRPSDHRELFRRATAAAGEDPARVTIYALRHTNIVRQLLAGVPIRLVAVAHDTSALMIERTYSRHIGEHGEEMIRATLLDTEPEAAENIVPIRRGG